MTTDCEICDRDRNWSTAVQFLETANAHAERFVRSIKKECLNRIIPLGERHLRRTLAEFARHYMANETTQGWAMRLINRRDTSRSSGPVRRRCGQRRAIGIDALGRSQREYAANVSLTVSPGAAGATRTGFPIPRPDDPCSRCRRSTG
jgi:hypothetical protein